MPSAGHSSSVGEHDGGWAHPVTVAAVARWSAVGCGGDQVWAEADERGLCLHGMRARRICSRRSWIGPFLASGQPGPRQHRRPAGEAGMPPCARSSGAGYRRWCSTRPACSMLRCWHRIRSTIVPGTRAGPAALRTSRAASDIEYPCGRRGQQPLQELHRPDELQRWPAAGKEAGPLIAGAIVALDRRIDHHHRLPRATRQGNRNSARSAVRPDRQSAVCVAILQEAGSLKRKVHALAGLELAVPSHLDIGEMDEAAAWNLRCLDHAPAFIGVERLDHARCPFRPLGRPLRHGPIMPAPRPRCQRGAA